MPTLVFILFLVLIGGIWLVVTVIRTAFRVRSLEELVRDLQAETRRSPKRLEPTEAVPSIVPQAEPEPVEPAVEAEVRLMVSPSPALAEAPPLLAKIETDREESASVESLEAVPESSQPVQEVAPINWERLMGVKMFAWVGGFALFLAVVFFVKYSFDHNLIPPALRVALGLLVGIGLVVGGVMMRQRAYVVTAHTLCATGVLILYASTFACRSPYRLLETGPTFALMVLVTLTAFLLAVRLNALVVAILGLAGGFLTPPLLSEGIDRPFSLFGYISLLVAGLIAVAFKRRWHFLILIAAVGTVVMQLGWVAKFFTTEKVFISMAIFLGFNLYFLLAFAVGERLKQSNQWLSASSIGLPFVTLGFVFYLLGFPELGKRPGVVFTFVLGADLCLLALVFLRHRLHQAHLVAGTAAFVILAVWTSEHLSPTLMNWALGLYLLFAILHAAFPVVLQSAHPETKSSVWSHLFPLLALLLVVVPVSREMPVSWLTWAGVLGLDLVAIGLAVLTASVVAIVAALVLTVVITGVWIVHLPAEAGGIPALLSVVGGFALFFFIAGLFAGKNILARSAAARGPSDRSSLPEWCNLPSLPFADMATQLSALSAILPFLLLIMASVRLPLRDPSPIFGLALVLVLLLIGLATARRTLVLVPVSLGSVLALEYIWHGARFGPEFALVPMVWSLLIGAVFILYPFLFREKLESSILPWACSALSGPLHFFLVHRAVSWAYPNDYMGMLPALFAVPMIFGLIYTLRNFASALPVRTAVLAWYGGSALFFITLVFPIQFEREWLTIAWALEGAALLWLFHRVPHPGLPMTGVCLLIVSFVRLALNPAVLSYHPRGAWPILNWYLYSYGIATACLTVGAKLLAPPRHMVLRSNTPPLLYGLGTVLAFLLVNIEIADYFSEGTTLTFQFSGNFARDMTYSLAWAMFGLGMLVVGIAKRLRAPRYASLGLLSITLLKLFFHDLSQLGQLYRIGAFIGVAIVLILASFLYQRFLADSGKKDKEKG